MRRNREPPPDQEKGWFRVPGVQDGFRSLKEQMLGLEPALAEARGRAVVDLGCAEGLIGFEFAKAGATVWACDYNAQLAEQAQRFREDLDADVRNRVQVVRADLRDLMRIGAGNVKEGGAAHAEIVLALAVCHKLDDPGQAVGYVADLCLDLALVRLQVGSRGVLRGKHTGVACSVNDIMQARGFALERTEVGPRTECVQYWRRRN